MHRHEAIGQAGCSALQPRSQYCDFTLTEVLTQTCSRRCGVRAAVGRSNAVRPSASDARPIIFARCQIEQVFVSLYATEVVTDRYSYFNLETTEEAVQDAYKIDTITSRYCVILIQVSESFHFVF